MRLAHQEFHFVIRFSENVIPVLVLERAELYRKYVCELSEQCDGARGGFVLSKNWEPVELGKSAVLLTNLFHIDINGKRLLAALQKKLNAVAVSPQYIQETNTIRQAISTWLLCLENEMPYPVAHEEIQVNDLVKASGVHLPFYDNSETEALTVLLKMCADLLKAQLLICVGLHDCFTSEELEEIYKAAAYEKVYMMDIERHQPDSTHPNERCYIIDKDYCEIYNE